MVGDPTPIYGQTCVSSSRLLGHICLKAFILIRYPNTLHQNYFLHLGSNSRTETKLSCFLLGILKPYKGNHKPLCTVYQLNSPCTYLNRHFNWMAQHGVDGAFLQRFAGQCDLEGGNEGIMRIRDEVGDRVKEAAEKEGRVFAIMRVSFFAPLPSLLLI